MHVFETYRITAFTGLHMLEGVFCFLLLSGDFVTGLDVSHWRN